MSSVSRFMPFILERKGWSGVERANSQSCVDVFFPVHFMSGERNYLTLLLADVVVTRWKMGTYCYSLESLIPVRGTVKDFRLRKRTWQ